MTISQELEDGSLIDLTVAVPEENVIVQLRPHVGRVYLASHGGVTLGPGDFWHLPRDVAEESQLFDIVDGQAAPRKPVPQKHTAASRGRSHSKRSAKPAAPAPEESAPIVSGAILQPDPVTDLTPEDLAAGESQPAIEEDY